MRNYHSSQADPGPDWARPQPPSRAPQGRFELVPLIPGCPIVSSTGHARSDRLLHDLRLQSVRVETAFARVAREVSPTAPPPQVTEQVTTEIAAHSQGTPAADKAMNMETALLNLKAIKALSRSVMREAGNIDDRIETLLRRLKLKPDLETVRRQIKLLRQWQEDAKKIICFMEKAAKLSTATHPGEALSVLYEYISELGQYVVDWAMDHVVEELEDEEKNLLFEELRIGADELSALRKSRAAIQADLPELHRLNESAFKNFRRHQRAAEDAYDQQNPIGKSPFAPLRKRIEDDRLVMALCDGYMRHGSDAAAMVGQLLGLRGEWHAPTDGGQVALRVSAGSLSRYQELLQSRHASALEWKAAAGDDLRHTEAERLKADLAMRGKD
jgi:hypothetical protein